MRRVVIASSVLCFIVSALLRAEDLAPPPAVFAAASSDEGATIASPIAESETDDGSTTASATTESAVTVSAAAIESSAASRYLNAPANSSVAQPDVEYLLVGPPHGIFERDCPNAYNKVLAPCEGPGGDPVYNCGVDIFRPDGLAPIGVWGDHTLPQGRALISYRYNMTAFTDNFVGTGRVNDSDVLATFPNAPTFMRKQTHRWLLEYAPTEDLTILGTLPYQSINIDYINAFGASSRTSTIDPGDITLMAMYVLRKWDRQQVHLNFGMQLPLGVMSTERFAPTPTSLDGSYPMRVSSGSYDLMPGLTYRGQSDWWTWGGQAMGTVRMGRTNFDYKLGDQVELTAWAARRVSDCVALSARLDGLIWGNIHGSDARLNQTLAQTNRPDLQAGQRLDILFGATYCLPGDFLSGQRIAVEAGFPAYQHLTGPQLGTQWLITAGWQMVF